MTLPVILIDGCRREKVTMTATEILAQQFEVHRNRLASVACRMLGSHTEAEDAVQETCLRLMRGGTRGVDNGKF